MLPVKVMIRAVEVPFTGSLKEAVKLIGLLLSGSTWPEAWSIVTVGAIVSMTMFLLAPSEPAAAGAGSVRLALLRPASWIVPPLSARALVDV